MSAMKKRVTRKPARKTTRRAAYKPAPPPTWTVRVKRLSTVWYYVSDWERAKQFYGETLGLPVAFAMEQAGWLEYGKPGHPTLALNRWDRAEPMPPPQNDGIAVLEVENVRAFIDDLRARGVRCDDVEEIPGTVILGTFYDPDGHRLQAAQSLYVPS